jgi:hypothetical protein
VASVVVTSLVVAVLSAVVVADAAVVFDVLGVSSSAHAATVSTAATAIGATFMRPRTDMVHLAASLDQRGP